MSAKSVNKKIVIAVQSVKENADAAREKVVRNPENNATVARSVTASRPTVWEDMKAEPRATSQQQPQQPQLPSQVRQQQARQASKHLR